MRVRLVRHPGGPSGLPLHPGPGGAVPGARGRAAAGPERPAADLSTRPARRADTEAPRARRLAETPFRCNADVAGEPLEAVCRLDAETARVAAAALDRLALSARAYHRMLRVARTIADLDDAERIGVSPLSEAMALRGDG